MQQDAILEALAERDRWQRRLDAAEGGAEREKALRQLEYYESLVKDMKKEVRPVRLMDFFRSMSALFRI